MTQKDQAIKTALTGDWQTAIELNLSLLKNDPNDIDSLNRLAFAYGEIGNVEKAQEIYQKVLLIDAYNPIASKNLHRLSSGYTSILIKAANANGHVTAPITLTSMFLEEIGKTKVIDLVNLCQPDIIRKLRIGELATLTIKRSKIFVLSSEKQYIGMLPDNISNRLIRLIDGGNEYEVYIKSFDNHRITVFIKETKRAMQFKNQPSFPSFEKSLFG